MDRYEWGAGTVVCGVDGSAPALAAATAAAHFAAALETTLTLVCTDDPWTRDLGDTDCHDVLDAAASAVDPLGPVDQVAALGNAPRQLARLARRRRASLLAIGARGRSSTRSRPLGSVATIVTGLAECPVLITPPRVDASAIARAVGRIHLSEPSGRS
jgi:nucleotide-binding universal stress UspA family protein